MHDLTTIHFSAIEYDFIGPSEFTHTPSSSPASIFGRILAKKPASLPGLPVSNDWVYESCRLAALIYCQIFCDRFPLSSTEATIFSYMPLVHSLRDAIEKTDISDCWGDMAGVLFWCTLVGGRAMRPAIGCHMVDGCEERDDSYGKNECCRRWITLLAVRLSVVLGFQYPDVVTTTLRRFVLV